MNKFYKIISIMWIAVAVIASINIICFDLSLHKVNQLCLLVYVIFDCIENLRGDNDDD